MTLPDTSQRSRRAVLAGAIGGVAALVAQSVQRPATVDAATGDIVKVGGSYTGTRTIFENPNGTGIIGVNKGGGFRSGLRGDSYTATGFGVIGMSTNGGEQSAGVLGQGPVTGVRGIALNNQGAGVQGITVAQGVGVLGRANAVGGVAGRFEALTGATMGLVVAGRVSFSTSGTAQIAMGQRSIVVTPNIDLTASSLILATLQSNPGADSISVSRAVPNPGADTFTIALTADAVADCSVAWFVIG